MSKEDDELLNQEFDFSRAVKNPYAKKVKQPVTINLAVSTVNYFKNLSAEEGIPYQTLINMYLDDCVHSKKKLKISWQ
ncbi:MAG: hypothetical protein VZT48_13100 [Bulleidia sp.]|nr:hypothetical protein [Bulleidia sp.]